MYFLLLLPVDRKLFIRVLVAIPALIIFLFGAAITYEVSTGGYMGNIFSIDYYIDGYLMSDESEEYAKWLFDADNGDTEDVPRITKLLLLGEVSEEYPNSVTMGCGVGTFKGGTIVDNSPFFKENEWLLIGSIPYLFHLIVQAGVIGVVWFVLFWVIKLGLSRANMHRNLNVQLYIIFLLILLLLYNDSLRNPFMCLVLMYILELSFVPSDTDENEQKELIKD